MSTNHTAPLLRALQQQMPVEGITNLRASQLKRKIIREAVGVSSHALVGNPRVYSVQSREIGVEDNAMAPDYKNQRLQRFVSDTFVLNGHLFSLL